MNMKENDKADLTLSRRSLLTTTAKLTAGAVAMYGSGATPAAALAMKEVLPVMTEEIAGHWTTF